MTKFKKITSLIMAAAIATSAFCCSVSAETPTDNASWSVSHNNVKYAPQPTTITCSLYMTYSTYGNRVYCNKASNTVNGGRGEITIVCTSSNATMPIQTLTTASQSVTCVPRVTSEVRGIKYYLSAETATYDNIFSASGTMVTIK